MQVAASGVLLDVDTAARQALAVDPSLVLEGPRFLITGSAVPADDAERHTGAGRFSFLRMRTMTLLEAGHATGAVSLAGLFSGEAPRCGDPGLTVPHLAELITIGGWPAQQERPVKAAARAARDYASAAGGHQPCG